jgi:hypothetical protein
VRGAGPAHSAWGNPQLLGGLPHLKTGAIWCYNMLELGLPKYIYSYIYNYIYNYIYI